MKKIFSIMTMAAVMLLAGKANAQVSVHVGYQSYTVKTDMAGVTGSDTEDGSYVGFTYDYNVSGGLGVAPGAYFAFAKDLMDIRIPMLVNYVFHLEKLGLGLFVGPQATIGFSGDTYDNKVLTRFDLGATVGGQISFAKFSFEFGYNLGLLNRMDNAPANCSKKTSQFFFGVGYTF